MNDPLTTAADPSAPAVAGTPGGGRFTRVVRATWDLPIVWHVIALVAVLVAVAGIIGHPGLFSADEGLAILQARQIADGTGWFTVPPFPSLDPTGLTFGVATGPADFVIYGKHPFYPALLSVLYRFGGIWAVLSVSILGTVAAAWLASRLADRFRPGSARWTFWAVGVGSPLFFDSMIVMAHSLAAALATGAALAVVTLHDRGIRVVPAVALAAAVLGSVLLRSEAVLFFAAVAITFVGSGFHRRDRRSICIGCAVIVLTLAGRLLDHRWSGSLVSSGGGVAEGGGGSVWRGLLGAPDTLFGPSLGGVDGVGAVLLLLSAVFVGVGVWQVRRRRLGPELRCPWIVATACMIAAAALGRPAAVPGLLVVCPVLLAGVLMLASLPDRAHAQRLLLVSSGLFALFVLATQYEIGGSAEWGARYLAIGVPTALAVLIPGLMRSFQRRLGPADRRMVVGSLVVMSLGVGCIAVASLHRDHAAAAATNRVVERLTATTPAGDGGRPVIVTDNEYLWRLGWPFYDRVRWMVVDPESEAAWVRRLADGGVERYVRIGPVNGRVEITTRETSSMRSQGSN